MRRHNDGFTLIESLIATAIAGGMVLAGTLLVSQVRARLAADVKQLHATFDAEAILTELMVTGGADIPAPQGTRPDGFRYRTDFAPYDWPKDANGNLIARHMYLRKATVHILDVDGGELFKLTTLLAVPEPVE
ncbi:PulJ/GspJ family protein [Oryzibacter oryziterrae]|uniref:PulJ/GspJ family protein n=1 Tax=Oryzibacter oryziterrae TaxID=2766474 RepID=UPI001F3B8E72|nr:type II secretion system protein [Oryzibacter oryziterrae]